MNSCLQNLVSVRDLCPSSLNTTSSSGYDIWQAPEVRYKGIAAITDAKYITGRELLLEKRSMAIREVESDFLLTIARNGYSLNLGEAGYESGQFDQNLNNPALAAERGISIFSAKPSLIRKLRISEVRIFPVESVSEAQLKIYDNGMVATYSVQLVGGMINSFPVDYTASGSHVRILIDNRNLATYSSRLTCMVGCGGTMPNECGYVKGWNGTAEVKSEGFGINAVFSCTCDYSQLLCHWSKQSVGEIIWYKMRALIQKERLNTERLNNFTIYGREDAEKKFIELENIYREKWNLFVGALPELFRNIKDDCVSCRKPQVVTNV